MLCRNRSSAVAVVFRHAAQTHSVQCTSTQGSGFAAPPSSLSKRQQWYFGQRSSLAPGRQLAMPASSQPMQNINGPQTCPQARCGFGCSISVHSTGGVCTPHRQLRCLSSSAMPSGCLQTGRARRRHHDNSVLRLVSTKGVTIVEPHASASVLFRTQCTLTESGVDVVRCAPVQQHGSVLHRKR
jgi:hypothetical protein